MDLLWFFLFLMFLGLRFFSSFWWYSSDIWTFIMITQIPVRCASKGQYDCVYLQVTGLWQELHLCKYCCILTGSWTYLPFFCFEYSSFKAAHIEFYDNKHILQISTCTVFRCLNVYNYSFHQQPQAIMMVGDFFYNFCMIFKTPFWMCFYVVLNILISHHFSVVNFF